MPPGDPHNPPQGIFDFDKDPLIDWEIDIFPYFEDLGELEEPWRWKNANPELDLWLESVRKSLNSGYEFDLRKAPLGSVSWKLSNKGVGRNACFSASHKAGSIVVIQKWPYQAHSLASQLRGVFSSMEEIKCRDLISWAQDLDQAEARGRCVKIIDGAGKCWTGLNSELKNIRKAIEAERIPGSKKYPKVVKSLTLIIESSENPILLLRALKECQAAGDILFRRELWREMQ